MRDNRLLIVFGLLVLLTGLFLSVKTPAAPTPPMKGVVATGSGSFISEKCDLVTAAHVIEDSTSIKVLIKGKWVDADVLGVDEKADIAILHVKTTECTSLKLDTTPELGETVFALGFPRPQLLTFEQILTKGIISNLHVGGMLLTDLMIAPGNSGGALLTVDGDLLGITNAAFGTGEEFGSSYSLSATANNIIKLIKDQKLDVDVETVGILDRILHFLGLGGIEPESTVLVGNFQSPTDVNIEEILRQLVVDNR